ncbi:MAG: hypothetical protein N0E37_10545, partial [Candidatus Thiodiazotropha taylori]|nr:hypothetical protein [Candidatus Thiodiazotropha taylori]MCW4244862.1 hypothetical protein [Candidatus Thiodiazotropha taylori]
TNGTIETGGSFIVPSTNANARLASQSGVVDYRVALTPTENRSAGDETGILTVRVTTPGGTTTSGFVIVND